MATAPASSGRQPTRPPSSRCWVHHAQANTTGTSRSASRGEPPWTRPPTTTTAPAAAEHDDEPHQRAPDATQAPRGQLPGQLVPLLQRGRPGVGGQQRDGGAHPRRAAAFDRRAAEQRLEVAGGLRAQPEAPGHQRRGAVRLAQGDEGAQRDERGDEQRHGQGREHHRLVDQVELRGPTLQPARRRGLRARPDALQARAQLLARRPSARAGTRGPHRQPPSSLALAAVNSSSVMAPWVCRSPSRCSWDTRSPPAGSVAAAGGGGGETSAGAA